MANFDDAFTFVMGLEDHSGTGVITKDADGLTRWGLLDKFQPGLVQAGFYTPVISGQQALAMAKPIYQAEYWNPIKGDDITFDEVAAQIFSIAVNDGVRQCTKLVQGVVNVTVDGQFRDGTLTAVNDMDPDDFIEDFNEVADDYYQAIVASNPTKKVDLQGWLNRVNAIDTFQDQDSDEA